MEQPIRYRDRLHAAMLRELSVRRKLTARTDMIDLLLPTRTRLMLGHLGRIPYVGAGGTVYYFWGQHA